MSHIKTVDSLRRWLSHPLTRDLSIDSPETTQLRREIIHSKPFLEKIYLEWYTDILRAIPKQGPCLEIGSGAGFLKELHPDLISSDIILVTGLDLMLDARAIPFRTKSMGAVVMEDVLHHIPDVQMFFTEAWRCLRPGGAIVMVEPWITPWCKLVFEKFHNESMDIDTPFWQFSSHSPLSSANTALPWIIFSRDRSRFDALFPGFAVSIPKLYMPFRYLLAGGISLRTLVPEWSYGFWKGLETVLSPFMDQLAMFALIILIKK